VTFAACVLGFAAAFGRASLVRSMYRFTVAETFPAFDV
jgi:hypothetical protein